MLLVVFSHVFMFSFGFCPTVNLFFCSFRMPLFFFVSGFFAYKAVQVWTKAKAGNILLRKVKVQLIGASFFCLIFSIFKTGGFPALDSLIYADNEYWFTFILFRLFVLYMLTVCVAKKIASDRLLILVVALVCLSLHFSYPAFQVKLPRFWFEVFKVVDSRTFYYFPYFALGLLARSGLGSFEKILSNDAVKVAAILFIVGVWSAIYLGYQPMITTNISFGYQSPLAYPLGLVTLLTVIQIFYTNRFMLEKDSGVVKALKFIGRRTLDIYFLHYFFLPDLKFLAPYFESNNSLFAQLIVGGSVSLVVAGLALMAGQLIRVSPTLAEWLLGVNRKAN